MPGLLDFIGSLVGADKTQGGIQTMPDGTISYAPMTTRSGGLDRILMGGAGGRRADAFNNQVMAAILQQQLANKGQLEATKEQGYQTRETEAVRGAEGRLTERVRSEEARTLQKELEELQAQIAEKKALLDQSLGVGTTMGVPLVTGEDVTNFGKRMTPLATTAAENQIGRLEASRSTPEYMQALRQGSVGQAQAPAVKNIADLTRSTPPATITTMPESDTTGMVNLANKGGSIFGMTPFSEETQQMINLPGGATMPGEVTRRTGYKPPVIPRPPGLRGAPGTNAPGPARPIRGLTPTSPELQQRIQMPGQTANTQQQDPMKALIDFIKANPQVMQQLLQLRQGQR